MKTAVIIVAIIAVATAAPKASKLHFRNLFKQPREIELKPNPRIIGGVEATPHSVPSQVFLEYTISGVVVWYCGGSLISPVDILTSASCNVHGEEVYVSLGKHRLSQNENSQVVVISRDIKIHPGYDSEKKVNDVGLIRLPTPVVLSNEIQIVNLPTRADVANSYVGKTARVSGWGLTDGFDNLLSDVLNVLDVPVISNSECEDSFGALPESNICTSGVNETGPCRADTGGPLIFKDVQIGIASFYASFCFLGFPSAYSRTTSFLDYIAENSDAVIK